MVYDPKARQYLVGDTVKFTVAQDAELDGVILAKDGPSGTYTIKSGIDKFEVPTSNIVNVIYPKPKL